MKKTYIVSLPDQSGAFLEVNRIVTQVGGEILRVNYNKSVDTHTLFLDILAEPEGQAKILEQLTALGYLDGDKTQERVLVMELQIPDGVGNLTPVLETLSRHQVNINYINSQTSGQGDHHFRMGVLVEQPALTKVLLEELAQIYPTEIVDYHVTEQVLDSTVFYFGFASEMKKLAELTQQETNRFLIYANQIMQFLDEKGENPMKTFEYLGNFARFIKGHLGAGYNPIVSKRQISMQVSATLVEPPCGSNTCVLDDGKELFLVDGGFSCYADELVKVLRAEIPDFDTKPKTMLLTHGDIDHCGMAYLCDRILVNEDVYQNFAMEQKGEPCYREQRPVDGAYCYLSKMVIRYGVPPLEKMVVVGKKTDGDTLSKIGYVNFGDLCFQLLQGNGGHVPGEMVLRDDVQKVMFTGDNLVNIRGFSQDQKKFNVLAPYLMTTVNMNSAEATVCRKLLQEMAQGYLVIPGHGKWMDC